MTVHIITTMPNTDPEHPLRLLCNNMLRSLELNVPCCNVSVIETGAEVSGDFNSPLYWRNTGQKFIEYKKYLEALPDDDICIFTDVDVVYLRNPIPIFEQLYSRGYDVIAQHSVSERIFAPSICLVKKTASIIFDIEPYFEQYTNYDKFSDQGFMNDQLKKHPEIKRHILSASEFPEGIFWYKNHESLPEPYAVHYSWITNSQDKITRMKEFGHWFLS